VHRCDVEQRTTYRFLLILSFTRQHLQDAISEDILAVSAISMKSILRHAKLTPQKGGGFVEPVPQ